MINVSKFKKTNKGEVITLINCIKEECPHYYKTLYSKKIIDNSIDDYFLHDIPKLSEDSCDECEGIITEGAISVEECTRALKQMQHNKSPGPDGLPAEFYTFTFPFIGKAFVKFINGVWLDKEKADQLSNWRPISLLNCDYKILSKTLYLRLSKVLEEIVHPDQTCSVRR